MATGLKSSKEFQTFLDANQYSKRGIVSYEKIFGKQFVSVGGESSTAKFCKELELREGQKVLDVGCGIGGSAFLMACGYGVDVYGIDLSENSVEMANKYRSAISAGIRHRVQFNVEDATVMDYPTNFYDVVYSRDTILHIGNKLALFQSFFKTLKPGGQLLITDYCHGKGNGHSQSFKNYVKQRGYVLTSVSEYAKLLEDAGFCNIRATDMTQYFIETCQNELEDYVKIKDEALQECTEQDCLDICKGWEDKIERAKDGDQAWGHFIAKKPYI